ncbi:hypothetical protein J8L85_13485 [Maribacter sp. MMG018]|uniref:hypothetical protein n=1 Tax=Maribacter sp. MMG018 TaxID=2822688 RepID=UPI001B35B288|nr:hypothetical protein [Maribacter sp. MMG018]MBQ4915461.1 hypothetical protein [Maribacter sp. MMG018]
MKQFLIILILLTVHFSVWGQGEEKVFAAPSSSFIDLSLQTHNGKLRFGLQDGYYVKSDGSYVKNNEASYFEMDKRFSHNNASRHAFTELLKIRFKEDMLAAMDKDYFTVRTPNMYDKEQKSYTAQQHVLNLANALCTTEQAIQFFCNTKEEDCGRVFPKEGYYNEPRNIRYWGGRGASEFQKLRAYTSFVKEKFPLVQEWAKTLYPDNKINGYYVAKTYLGTYDFKEGGYWLRTGEFSNNGFLLRWFGLQPSNSSERKLVHPNGSSILLKMSPEKAETFSEKYQYLFLVFDVTGQLNGLENYRADQLKTTFTLNSPVIEIYTDDALTNRVGEIDINTMVSKTR